MTAFFLPGLSGDGPGAEKAYSALREGIEIETGVRPCDRRILQLWSRRNGADCITEVGCPDPIHGGTVIAIFDLGPRQPFVVQREPSSGVGGGVREVLGSHTYTVTEFAS